MEIRAQNIILIITAISLAIFSLVSLFKIKGLNEKINSTCEPKEYINWTKEVKVSLTPERIETLKSDYQDCLESNNKKTITEGVDWDQINRTLTGKDNCEAVLNTINQGFETKTVPDEEKQTISRKEATDYEQCIKNQNEAIKNRPEEYKFLFIVDTLILVGGLLFVFGFKNYGKNN